MMAEDEFEDNSDRRGILLTHKEVEAITKLVNSKHYDHVRVAWQGRSAVIWPMRLAPREYETTND